MNPTNNITDTPPENLTTPPRVVGIQEKQETKIGNIVKKIFIILNIIVVGAAITTAVAIALIPFGPIALTASIVTGMALTILAVGLAIYFLTRSNASIQKQNTLVIDSLENKNSLSPSQVIGQTDNDPKSLGKKLAEDAIRNFDKFNDPKSGQDIEHFAQSLIESQNRYKLSLLNKKLKEEVNETIASTIMNDWDLIGHDIRTNRALLDDARVNLILENAKKAQAVKENRERYTGQLNVLKGMLATGEMPARKLVIEKNFPLLAELTKDDSLREKELNTLLQEAAVRQQMKKGPLFSPSKGEKDVYKMLKLPIEHIDPLKIPESVSRKTAFILLENSPFFEEGEEIFISKVKTHIKKYAIEDRIEQMAQKDSGEQSQKAKAHLPQVQILIRLKDHLNGKMRRQHQEMTKELSESSEEIKNCHDDLLKRLMLQSLSSNLSQNFQVLMNDFFQSVETKVDPIGGGEDIEGYKKKLNDVHKDYLTMERAIPDVLRDKLNRELPEKFKWYHKWINHIQKPFVQGIDDTSAALGNGVCLAMSLRLVAYEINNPSTPHKLFAEQIDIQPEDRFFQALYSHEKTSNLNDKTLSHVGLKNCQTVETSDQAILINANFNQDNFLEWLSEKVKSTKTWKQTKGVSLVSLGGGEISNDEIISKVWGHAIYTRIDPTHGIYRLFDPNCGLLIFNNEDLLTECLQGLIKNFYPTTLVASLESYETVA